MFSQKIMGRKMFQEGGMATPSVPSSVTGGGIVEGLGLNEPEAMPPIPPQDQEMITEGMADIAGKLGQVDAAEDTASLINAIRSDNQPLDARYTELANYVGRKDATATPESVLTLVQPTFELMEQGGGMGMLGSDMLQGAAPMEESMTATMTESPMGDTATMTETMETPNLFNGGGLVKKSKAPVYRQQGSPPQGENIYTGSNIYSVQNTGDINNIAGITNPYFSEAATPPPTSPLTQTEQMLNTQAQIEAQQAAMHPSNVYANQGLGSQSAYLSNVLSQNPYTEASVRERMTRGLNAPQTAEEIMSSSEQLIEGSDVLSPTLDVDAEQKRLAAILKPSATPVQTPEELLKAEEDFVGTVDNRPEALFALAQGFNEMAHTPGKFLGSLAAGSGKAAELLAPLAREQQMFDLQRKQKAFDRNILLADKLRGEDREIAIKALGNVQAATAGNQQFMQQVLSNSIQEAALQARNQQEREVAIRETTMRLGLDWDTSQMDAVNKLFEDYGMPEYDGVGREFRMISDPITGQLKRVWTGFQNENGTLYNALPNRLKATDPSYVAPQGATIDQDGNIDLSNTRPVQIVGNMSEQDVGQLKQRMFARQGAITELENMLREAVPELGTGPEAVLKTIATHGLGTFGADWANYFSKEQAKARLDTWARKYIAANALSDRYAMGEQAILNDIISLESKFWENPSAQAHRLQTIMIGMLNDNEFDQALMEGRAPGRIEYMAGGTKADPLNYSKENIRRTLALAGEQGTEGTWSVRMTPQDATVVDFAQLKPDGTLESYDEVMSAFNAGQRTGADKYQQFVENENPVFADIILKRPEGSETSEPELQPYVYADLPVSGRGRIPDMGGRTSRRLQTRIP